MHNSGTALGKEEATLQKNSPKGGGGWDSGQELRRGPGSGSRGTHSGHVHHSPVSLRQLLQDGSS